jgi:hypothetical protein
MKIVSFIEETQVIEKTLRHCKMWKEAPRSPPVKIPGSPVTICPTLDYQFFDQNCV